MKSSTRNIIVVGAVAVVLGGTVFALNKVGGRRRASSGSSSTGVFFGGNPADFKVEQ